MPEVSPLVIFEYATPSGKRPFLDWMHSLADARGKARIYARINRALDGNLGDHKSLGDGLFEMRVDHGPGYRVYFGRDGDTVVVLLCGGDKSRQAKDIETARGYWAEYRREKSCVQ